MKNSLRKNMILLRHAARRGKPPDVVEESQNFMKDLEEELRLQAAGAGR